MPEEYMRAIFLLANVNIIACWKLANGYIAEHTELRPWWLVQTSIGMITIGWRKRVINIDWSDTPIRRIITEHEVTKENHYVHAYGYARAVEYIKELHEPNPT